MEIKIACKGADNIPLEELKEFQGDIKLISNVNLEKLKRNIIKNGFSAPIFIWKNKGVNYILDGTQRRKALISLKDDNYIIPELPVVYIYAKNKNEAKKKLLAITSQYGRFQLDALRDFGIGLDMDIGDLDLPGIDTDELEMAFGKQEDQDIEIDDKVPEKVPKISKLGDLWELNGHRILCGDSTDAEQIEGLMAGEKAGMVFTDPPYGMGLDTDYSSMIGIGKGKKYNNIKGDHKDFDSQLISSIFVNFVYCKEIFLWGADYYAELIPKRNKGCFIVWDKMGDGEGVNDSYDKMFGSNFELCWSRAKHKRATVRVLWKGIFGLSKEDTKKRIHPTQKPTELILWFLDKFSKKNKLIIDPFLGSGSTIIACEKVGRICYGIEIEPYYVDIIICRWIDWRKRNGKSINLKLNGKRFPIKSISKDL